MTTVEDQRHNAITAAGTRPARSTDGGDDLALHALLTTQEAAQLTPYTAHGLENLRSAGRGPAFIKVKGGAVAYRLCDLLEWQESHRIGTLDQR